jgi:hypothetical protein
MGARLSLSAKKRYEALVDASGEYTLGKVPVGTHSLKIAELQGPTGRYDFRIRRRIQVEENFPHREDFEIYTGTLSGRVVYEGIEGAVRGIRVVIRIQDKDAPYSVRMRTVTGLDGSFLFEGVPVGTYTVDVEERELGCQPISGVRVFPGGRTRQVTLTMVAPVWVKGRVILPTNAKHARWLILMIKPAEEKDANWKWVRLDKESGEFETRELIPGPYVARLLGELPQRYELMEFYVPPGGLNHLELIPQEKPADG